MRAEGVIRFIRGLGRLWTVILVLSIVLWGLLIFQAAHASYTRKVAVENRTDHAWTLRVVNTYGGETGLYTVPASLVVPMYAPMDLDGGIQIVDPANCRVIDETGRGWMRGSDDYSFTLEEGGTIVGIASLPNDPQELTRLPTAGPGCSTYSGAWTPRPEL